MEIYFYKSNAHGGSSEQEALIKKSLIDYVQKKYKGDRENRLCGKDDNEKDVLLLEKLCDALNNAEIKRGEYGKPYIAVKDTDFAGFDGQRPRRKTFKMRRIFCKSQRRAVCLCGSGTESGCRYSGNKKSGYFWHS